MTTKLCPMYTVWREATFYASILTFKSLLKNPNTATD